MILITKIQERKIETVIKQPIMIEKPITNATLNRKKLNDHLKSYTKQIRQTMYVSLSIK